MDTNGIIGIDEQRSRATDLILAEPSAKFRYGHHVQNQRTVAAMHALVVRDDAQGLARHLNNWRADHHELGRICHELWYFALLEGKATTFALLCERAKEKAYTFPLVASLDELPNDLQMWALSVPSARNLWLSQTEPLSAKGGYKTVDGFRFLERNAEVDKLHKELDAKTPAFHEHMRLFIEECSMQTLMKNGAFLHTIAYYKEPSKKHLRVAATGTRPVYDLERMEKHWPGIRSCFTAFSGLGLSKEDCEERVRKMISNKQAGQIQAQTNAYELPLDFL